MYEGIRTYIYLYMGGFKVVGLDSIVVPLESVRVKVRGGFFFYFSHIFCRAAS